MPVSRQSIKESLRENHHVLEVGDTVHGVLVIQEPGNTADTFGSMISEKGWVLDFISADRRIIHFVKLDGVIGDNKGTSDDLAVAEDAEEIVVDASDKRIVDAVVALREANELLGELRVDDLGESAGSGVRHLRHKISEWEDKIAEEVDGGEA